jgi:hypothetical protein
MHPPFLILELSETTKPSGGHMKTNKRKWATLAFWTVLLGSAFSWIQFLWPPFQAFLNTEPQPTFWAILRELLNPFSTAIYDDTIFGGWLFLLITAVSFVAFGSAYRSLLLYVENSRAAISVLATEITLDFADVELTTSTITRDQLIHANQPEVRAYRSSLSMTSPSGEMVPNSYRAASSVGGALITSEVLSFGDKRSQELIELFRQHLPVNIFVTYLPNWLVYLTRGIFSRTIVYRQTQVTQLNEYNGEKPNLALASIRYPVTNAVLKIQFPRETGPDICDVRAFLLSDNLADSIDVIPDIGDPDASFTEFRSGSCAAPRCVWLGAIRGCTNI